MEISHPAVAAPLVAGLAAGTPFMAYEYVDGESLDVALRRDARPPEALQWIALLAGAVDAAHARGLEHGALHLRDVLVFSEGVCATGFGIARALEHVQLDVPVRRPYAAPEVMAGRRWGPPADRFAVAVLAYELLTGTRPSGSSDDAVADLLELRPDVADPAGFQQAFRNALAEDPAIRSASATAFATALARAAGTEAMDGAPSPRRGETVADEGADSFADATGAPHAAGAGDVDPDDSDPVGGTQEFEERAGREPGGSGGGPLLPEQIPLPDDAIAALEYRTGESEGREEKAPEAREDKKKHPSRSQRGSRSRRRSRKGGTRRRTGPVVAVRDDVHFDPLDDGVGIEPAVERTEYDEDVPPPPSPTSMRAIAPVIAAVAVGVFLAYLVLTGLGTSGDGTTGGAPPSADDAALEVEATEEVVAAREERSPASAAGGPLTLVDEPIVPVGDPPAPDAEPIPPVDPPAPAAPAPDAVPPTAGSQAPTPVAPPPALPTRARPSPFVNEEPVRPAETGTGSLLVRSRPPGARVRVNDVPVGVTPVEVPDVAFGTHRVRIELPGYRPWVTEVDVSGSEQVRVGASLEAGSRP